MNKEKPKILPKIVIPLLIIAIGFIASKYIASSAPKAKKNRPEATTTLVDIVSLNSSDENIVIKSMGKVISAKKIALKSRVAGEISKINADFLEGGFIKKGDEIIRLDPKDYELALSRAKSVVANSQYSLKIERGHQYVAKREWELLNKERHTSNIKSDLALRKPHLNKAHAELKAALAELEQAKLNLKRTTIRAPFNSIILSKEVDIGSSISTQEKLATLVGTDNYHIMVSLPIDRLKWLAIPNNNSKKTSKVTIFSGDNSTSMWVGSVTKLLGDLESEGRMARLLVTIEDPLGLKSEDRRKLPLLIGSYVHVEIEGQKVNGVFSLPRSALKDNESVWIASDDNKLEIRPIEVIWRDKSIVLIKDGLNENEQLVISNIPTPVEGLPLRINIKKQSPIN